jgi:hypothetical protein
MHLFACITCVSCCSMYSWVAQPHTSGSHSKHTISNAQGDTPSEGGFDAFPSTWETPESIDCTTARRRTVQAAAPRGLAEDCTQNALKICVCGPQPSWSGDLLCFGNDQTDKECFMQIICQCSEPCQADLRLAQPLKKSLKARVLFDSISASHDTSTRKRLQTNDKCHGICTALAESSTGLNSICQV